MILLKVSLRPFLLPFTGFTVLLSLFIFFTSVDTAKAKDVLKPKLVKGPRGARGISNVSAGGAGTRASGEALRNHVATLTEMRPFRHFANLESLNKTAAYITAQWQAMGLKVRQQKYTVQGNEYKNLIVMIGPENGHDRIVVGAHYDVCGNQVGADDNASGVAGLIELSRLLVAHANLLPLPIELVAYTLEEPPFFDTPYMGSYVHAESLFKAKIKIKYMISLEMIGYFNDAPGSQRFPVSAMKMLYPDRGNFIAVVGDMAGINLVRAFKKSFRQTSALDVRVLNAPHTVEGIDYSDHRSYWHFKYPAMMVTDTSFYRNKNYHEATDTIEKLDFNRMAEVVRGVYGVVSAP